MSCVSASSTSTPAQLQRAIEHLRRAHDSRQLTSPVRALLAEGDLAGAYAVQHSLVEQAVQSGRRVSGYKVGLTTPAAQQAVFTTTPMSGALFSDMEVPEGASLNSDALHAPRVEAEVAFVIGRDLDDPQVPFSHILRAVDFVLPAIEIVDSRIQDWDVHAIDLIADFAGASHYVLGTRPVSLADVDLKLCGMTLEVSGEQVSFGMGMANMGHPLHALHWLAKQVASNGRTLREGDVVLSGSLAPMTPVKAGQHIHVSIQGLGEVGFHVDALSVQGGTHE